MKLATLRVRGGTTAARLDGTTEDGTYTEIEGYDDLAALFAVEDWRETAETASGIRHAAGTVELETVVPEPSKVLCVGLNYTEHILEMGRVLPKYPTIFAKFADTLTGPADAVTAVEEDPALDWEGELVIVIGALAYRVSEEDADGYIAGYTAANDISMRTWQARTQEWLQGKIWAKSTPIGPVVVTSDEFDHDSAVLTTTVNGTIMQDHPIADLLFTPAQLVAYLSTITPLRPGDLILTGTPGGVGKGRTPEIYLQAGDHVEVSIDGIGSLRTAVVQPAQALVGATGPTRVSVN
jgi:acylpyruvate hydrolase